MCRMKVVTDAAANLSSQKAAELQIEMVPFQITFMGKTYRDGVDILPEDLYRMYTENPGEFSTTSQPSVGDFVAAYEKYPDEDILSIHLSSGLSGAYSSAVHAARIVSEERVMVVDSKTVGPALGWMVEIAAHGAKLGWTRQRILDAIEKIKENTITMVSFSDVKYLRASGRVSHLQGIIASILKIKPIIGMNEETGMYSSLGQEMTVGRAVGKMVDIVHKRFGQQKIRLQLMHGSNLPGVEQLHTAITGMMSCVEEKLIPVTLVLGAHAGPTVIGLAAMPFSIYESFAE
jgi:DegV family protein with EDD domain